MLADAPLKVAGTEVRITREENASRSEVSVVCWTQNKAKPSGREGENRRAEKSQPWVIPKVPTEQGGRKKTRNRRETRRREETKQATYYDEGGEEEEGPCLNGH